MSERPGLVFGALVSLGGVLVLALIGGLAMLGAPGVAALAATLLGSLSACVFFLAELRDLPLGALALFIAVGASTVGAVRTLLRYRTQQRLIRDLPWIDPPDMIAGLARAAGVELRVARSRRPAAFCTGLFSRRVVLTTGLLERLDDEEARAVIWHEAEHAHRHEPLRCLIADLVTGAFFWLPALRDLRERYLLARELEADRMAIRRTGPRALASALYEVTAAPGHAGAVGLADMAAARIDRIFDPTARLPRVFRPVRLLASGFTLAALALLLASPERLDLNGHGPLEAMLTSMSLHGLPGMAAGFAFNVGLLAAAALTWSRLKTRRA